MFAMGGHALSPRAPDEETVAPSSSVPACVAPASSPAALPPGTVSPLAETKTSRSRRGTRSRKRYRLTGVGGRRKAGESRRDARLAPWHQLAPDNTTDFLMDDHGSAHDEVVFDRYGWPTPRPSSRDGSGSASPQLEPLPPWSIDDLRSMVSRHVALEHNVERLEERLGVLRRQRPTLADEDDEEDDDEACSSGGDRDEVRMCPETAAKIRVLQAEISRLESENEVLSRDNELLAARARQPLVSDADMTSDSESDSSDSECCGSDSSSSSSSTNSSSSDSSSSTSPTTSTSSTCSSVLDGATPPQTQTDVDSGVVLHQRGSGLDSVSIPQQTGSSIDVGVVPQQTGSCLDSGSTPQQTGSSVDVGVVPQQTGSGVDADMTSRQAVPSVGDSVTLQHIQSDIDPGVIPQEIGSGADGGSIPQ